jgi:O-antigen ligase
MHDLIRQLRMNFSHLDGIPLWFVGLIVLSCSGFVLSQSMIFLGIPFVVLGAMLVLQDVRKVYLLLYLTVPLSYEVYFSFGLGTDFPTEQFMWILTGIGVLLFAANWRSIPAIYMIHPISMLLIVMLAWIALSAFFSQNVVHSVKYLLAKTWYIIAMYFMALYFLKSKTDIKQVFKYLFAGFIFSVVVVFARHLLDGLTYDTINFVLWPFYRNHVSYASMIAVCLPFFFWYANNQKQPIDRLIFRVLFFFLLCALYFTYTRAAILASVMCIPFYFIIKFKLFKPVFVSVILLLGVGAASMVKKYNYLNYAPNYTTTIQHQNFDDVLSATYRLEDLSTMERFYRWVAGYHMIMDRPMLGFGPANFYNYYKSYTVKAFTTYVSDNEDQSGIHNYYLMLLVEQGVPGLLVFLVLVYVSMCMGQRLYHRLQDPFEKSLVLAALGSLFIALTISFMNDMLETDKVGALFFLSLAILVRATILLRNREEISLKEVNQNI